MANTLFYLNFFLFGTLALPYISKEETVYEYETLEESDNEVEYKVMTTPRFLSTPQTLLVNEGENIRLPCKVDRLEGFVILWKRNKDIITVGDQIVDKTVRLETSKNGNELIIGPASPADEADYTCQISAYKPTEITHSVKIRVKPVIMISPEGVLEVAEGSPAHISCSVVAGSPTPQIVWRRREKKMPDGTEKFVGNILHFPKVSRHHTGHYMCEADNGFGPTPVSRHMKLVVHHIPKVEQLKSELYSGLNLDEDIICSVHSSPRAEVIWTKNGEVLPDDETKFLVSQRGNQHILKLNQITKDMFGIYSCEAKNELGSDKTSIEVSGKAEPVVFTSADISLYTDSYTLSWTVKSKSEVANFHMQFKETSGSKWSSIEVKASKSPNGSFQGTALLSHLHSATQYDAKVSSKNDFGYSEPKYIFNFATKGAVPYHQPSVSSVKLFLPATFTSLIMLVSLISLL